MSDEIPTHLPIFDDQPDDGPSCSPKVYVSNEEMTILESMRRLRVQAVELKRRLEAAGSADERRDLEAELAGLRARRTELASRREQAFRRKMIMLGHLPPDDEIELF